MKGLISFRPLTKMLYSVGVIFLLAGMLASAMNIPVNAQVGPVNLEEGGDPETTPEPELDSSQTCSGDCYDLKMDVRVNVTDCVPTLEVKVKSDGDYPYWGRVEFKVNDRNHGGDTDMLDFGTLTVNINYGTPDKVDQWVPIAVTTKDNWSGCNEAKDYFTVEGKLFKSSNTWPEDTDNINESITKPANCGCCTPSITVTAESICPTEEGKNSWLISGPEGAQFQYTPTQRGTWAWSDTVTIDSSGTAIINTDRSTWNLIYIQYFNGCEWVESGDNPIWAIDPNDPKCAPDPEPDLSLSLNVYVDDDCLPYFDLSITNSGDGDAENVMINLSELVGSGLIYIPTTPINVGTVPANTSNQVVYIHEPIIFVDPAWYDAAAGATFGFSAKAVADGGYESSKVNDSDSKPSSCAPGMDISVVSLGLVDCVPTFEVTVSNTSSYGTLNNVNLNLEVLGGFHEPSDPYEVSPTDITGFSVAAGGSKTFTVSINTNDEWKKLSEAGVSTITLKADATADNGLTAGPKSASVTQDETCDPDPGLLVELTGDVDANCEPVFYLTVTNTGAVPLKNVYVSFSILEGASYVLGGSIPGMSIGILDAGQTSQPVPIQVPFSTTIDWASAPVGSYITLKATATADKVTDLGDLGGTACYKPYITVDSGEAKATKPESCTPAQLVLHIDINNICDPVIYAMVENTGDVDVNGVVIELNLTQDTGNHVTSIFPQQTPPLDIPAHTQVPLAFILTVDSDWDTEGAAGHIIEVTGNFKSYPDSVSIGDSDYVGSITNQGFCGEPPELEVTLELGQNMCSPEFTVTVENKGGSKATDVVLNFFADETTPGEYVDSFSPASYTIGDLLPGDTNKFTIPAVYVNITSDWATATAGTTFDLYAVASFTFDSPQTPVYSNYETVTNPGECGKITSPYFEVTLDCPYYDVELQSNVNVWNVKNTGDRAGSFDWTSGTESGTSPVLNPGQSYPVKALRNDGTETLVITYTRYFFDFTAPGYEGSEVVTLDPPAKAMSMEEYENDTYELGCSELFIPNIELTLTQACPDYDTMENVWLVENIGNMDSEFNWAVILSNGTGEGSEGTAVPILIGEVVEIRTTRVGDGGDLMTIDYFDEDNVNQIVGPQNSYTDAAAQEMQCLIPETGIGILDPYCEYAGSGNWWNVWTVENLSVYNPLPFSWVLLDENSNPVADGVGNIPVATEQLVYKSEMGTYTLVVTWSDGSETFLTDTKTKEICEYEPPTPPEPPVELPPGPPIPVTAAGGPEVVDAGILIPVTGEDLSEPATFMELMMSILPFAGLLLIGAAMLIQGLTKKQQES